MASFDLVVVGAGLHGIAASRFYLDIHPNCRLTILEEDTCVGGGVWSSPRLYNGFWSQSGLRMAGFSDTPLTLPPEAEIYHDIFESNIVSFGFRVQSIQKEDGKWRVSGQRNEKVEIIWSSKLIVATGHTSLPVMPNLPDQASFKGPVLHQKSFGKASSTILASSSSSSYQNVTILGGGNSAADMVYDSVKAGKTVSWIIRLHLQVLLEKALTWWTRAIHGSDYGRNLIAKIWLGADQACRDLANFEKREGARPGFQKLKSTTAIFWCTGPIGMVQREDFWDTIAKSVSVYRSDIRTMRPSSIVLHNGSEIESDVLFCGTGWSWHYPFFAKEQAVKFGLPHAPERDDDTESSKWETLLKAADQQVIAQFPQLAHPPPHFERPTKTTATRLYNCIAPLSDSTIVFLGDIYLSNSFRTAEAQAIWATAYFDGRVRLPPREEAEKEIAYMTTFSKRRYPSHGATGNYFHMDLVGYTDKLMKDVGLVSHRRGSWLDLVYPCLASDFKGMREEYLSKLGSPGERDL